MDQGNLNNLKSNSLPTSSWQIIYESLRQVTFGYYYFCVHFDSELYYHAYSTFHNEALKWRLTRPVSGNAICPL